MTIRELAIKKMVFSPLCAGREKGDLNDILGENLTMTDFDIVSDNDGKPYSVFIVNEHPDKFYFGGMVITDLVVDIYENFCENGKSPKEVLDNEGGLKFYLSKEKSKTGREYTKVNVQ